MIRSARWLTLVLITGGFIGAHTPALALQERAAVAPAAGPGRLLKVPGAAPQLATTFGGCAARPVRVVYSGYGEASATPTCPQTHPDGNYGRLADERGLAP